MRGRIAVGTGLPAASATMMKFAKSRWQRVADRSGSCYGGGHKRGRSPRTPPDSVRSEAPSPDSESPFS